MPIPYDQWWASVGNHLDKIEAGAKMCARHAAALPVQPRYPTLAESDIERCETVLEAALAELRSAREIYRNKAVED